MNFFLGAMLFEDVGITVIEGASDMIRNRTVLESAAGLLASEGTTWARSDPFSTRWIGISALCRSG
ncbi:MAG: ferritin-like domain-containing protein [Pseudomonadota bacterium]|nr:ferritin-like domain-containing protein [Pseudomonadota bacterium]